MASQRPDHLISVPTSRGTRPEADGTISVHSVSEDAAPHPPAHAPGGSLLPSVADPNGAALAAKSEAAKGFLFVLWELASGKPVFQAPKAARFEAVDFSPDRGRVAVAVPDTAIRIYDVTTGKEQWQRLPRGWLAVEASV